MRILARKAFRFKSGITKSDKQGHEKELTFTCKPYELMDAPDWIENDPYFNLVLADKDIEIAEGKKQEKVIGEDENDNDAPDSPYKGNTKAQLVEELLKRGKEFDRNSNKTVLEEMLIADDNK